MESQVVCMGCRNLLFHPRGAANVCCVICNTITPVPPPGGMEMAQLICAGCWTFLVYARGAMSVRCFCCNTVNHARAASHVAHVNCGHCRTTLMYPYGVPSVKCAICQYITHVQASNMRVPISIHGPNVTTYPPHFATARQPPRAHYQTVVVVENPKSVDVNGRLVDNIVVGVACAKK